MQASFNHMAGELTTALGDLQAERDRVSRLLAERRELFAGVSHELRTPLAVLRAAQEALAGRAGLVEDAQAAHDWKSSPTRSAACSLSWTTCFCSHVPRSSAWK